MDMPNRMNMQKDPVCDMEVDPKTANYQTTYQGHTYYFDSADCKRDFEKNPKKYVKAEMKGDEHRMKHNR